MHDCRLVVPIESPNGNGVSGVHSNRRGVRCYGSVELLVNATHESVYIASYTLIVLSEKHIGHMRRLNADAAYLNPETCGLILVVGYLKAKTADLI
jgi:hypothetical protein